MEGRGEEGGREGGRGGVCECGCEGGVDRGGGGRGELKDLFLPFHLSRNHGCVECR